jgi:hypothetical protein
MTRAGAVQPAVPGGAAQQAGLAGQEAPVSYAAVDSEVLFCCVVALAVLLVVFTGVVITTPSGSRGGAHRRVPRHGTHRVRMSTGQVRGLAGRPGRHRAAAH